MRRAAGLVLMVGVALPFTAPAREPARNTPTAEAQTPVSSEPEQTSASFGDWVVRCERIGTKQACEVAQSLLVKGQQTPIAQAALGRGEDEKGALTLTALLPINIDFDKPPTLAAQAKDAEAIKLDWLRCIPGGCLASVRLDPQAMRNLRSATAGRFTFNDASERIIALPLSFRGLDHALNDLEKEVAAARREDCDKWAHYDAYEVARVRRNDAGLMLATAWSGRPHCDRQC